MKIKGRVQIGRVSSTQDDYIEINFIDGDAGIEFASAKLSLEQFALAITSQAISDVPMEVLGLDKVGMKYEHKEELLPLAHFNYSGYDTRSEEFKKAAREFVAPYEVDGWSVSDYWLEQIGNHYRKVGDSVKVTFGRWVEKTNEQV